MSGGRGAALVSDHGTDLWLVFRLPGAFGLALGIGAALALSPSAMAQAPPGNFGPAQQVPQGSPLPRIVPPAPPKAVTAATPAPQSPPVAGPDQVVRVHDVAIEGAHAYAGAELAPLVAGLAGEHVQRSRIEAARDAIQARYRADGYVLTTIKVTLAPSGSLRFVVTEGRIASVKLDGDIGPAGVQVLRFLNHLTELRPIDSASLERWLLLAQDVPGITVHAVLQPSTEEPGALTLIAQVSRQAFSGLSTVDNRGFKLTGPEQGLVVLDAQSFTSLGEKTEVSLFGTARGSQLFGQVAEEMFLGGSGLKLRLYAGSGTADPSGNLGAEGYHGVTTSAGVSLSYPLIRARQQSLTVAGYFDALQSDISTAGILASEDYLRVVRLGADYALQDLVLGGDRTGLNAASVRVSRGIPGIGGSRNGADVPGRVGERVDFTKVDVELSRTQTLFQPWSDASVALQGLLSGQYSPDVLPPAEKFYLGGSRYNRGFYAGEVTGDNAAVASIELQLNTALTIGWLTPAPFQVGAQFYAFQDWGETWERQRTDVNRRLSSSGGGARVSVTRYTEFDVEGVHRETRQPQGPNANTAPLHADGIYWRVLTRF